MLSAVFNIRAEIIYRRWCIIYKFMNVRNKYYYLAEFNGFYPSFHQKFMEMDLCSQMLWCLSKRRNAEEMLMVIIIEEKYKSKVDVNNEENQATSPYVRIQSWRCNLSLSFSAVVLCTVQILSRPKRGRKF